MNDLHQLRPPRPVQGAWNQFASLPQGAKWGVSLERAARGCRVQARVGVSVAKYGARMPDWSLAVLYVALTWGYQAFVAYRRKAQRREPPFVVLPLAAVVVGVAIGDWWAPALALSALFGWQLVKSRDDALSPKEAIVGTSIDASIIAAGCLLSRLV